MSSEFPVPKVSLFLRRLPQRRLDNTGSPRYNQNPETIIFLRKDLGT